MDEQTMCDLLEIYDAKEELHQILEMLIDEDCAPGYGDGILGKLSRVTDIIMRRSSLDDDQTEFWEILEDKTLENHRKARMLLGKED